MSALRDLVAIRFSHFADAAILSKRELCVVATQRLPPFRPFKSAVCIESRPYFRPIVFGRESSEQSADQEANSVIVLRMPSS